MLRLIPRKRVRLVIQNEIPNIKNEKVRAIAIEYLNELKGWKARFPFLMSHLAC